ncbi:hypothetical protein RRG08_007678 [Elysia crispata]|uniref:DUF659 domain-containing protein n=1 Tax=Elysia crispata TaxID=231223 RepID=A0AAE0Y3R4_9GAST|nr:hypothetical protein RRG08_007678 [Elysia crispata]
MDCPRDSENSPSSRTDENNKADYAMFSTEGKRNLSKAKKYHNVIRSAMLPFSTTHTAVPYLHILLGVVKKHHELLEQRDEIDKQIVADMANLGTESSSSHYNCYIRELRKLEDLEEKKSRARYEIVSRKRLTLQLLPGKYNEEKMKLVREMEDMDHMSITTDCWIFREMEGYMTIIAHFINAEWKLRSGVLSTTMVIGIAHWQEACVCLEASGISKKVTTIVTNNAANVKAAVELLKVRNQPCFDHTLNLIVKDAIRRTI